MVWLFVLFAVLVLALLALDLMVFHRGASVIGTAEALRDSAVWVGLGLLFTVAIYFIYEHHVLGAALPPAHADEGGPGLAAATLYLTGFVLEKALSIDNLFVMAVIFRSFGVGPAYQHRVLYLGILGAIVFRAIMIFGGVWLVVQYDWIFYVFGGYLLFTGGRLFSTKHGGEGEKPSWLMGKVRRLLKVSDAPHEGHLLIRVDGRRYFSVLALALLSIEFADVVFAVDSVPAVLAVTTDSFIVLTSNLFAILGLRSLYFVLASVVQRFAYLHYSLAAILIFIGAKMIGHQWVHIPAVVSLAVLLLLLGAGIGASVWRTRRTAVLAASARTLPLKAVKRKAKPPPAEPTKAEPTKAEPTKAEPTKAEPTKGE